MQFKLVLLGALLLTAGLIAYSAIPNVQRSPILTRQDIMTEQLSILAGEFRAIPRNITTASTDQNELRVNITVTGRSGELASLLFQVFPGNNSLSCPIIHPQDYLVVSNESLAIPADKAGTYCFIFYNESDESNKTISISAILHRRSEQILVSRNGSFNMAGLGVGTLGFLVFVYGVTRKTVIPWE